MRGSRTLQKAVLQLTVGLGDLQARPTLPAPPPLVHLSYTKVLPGNLIVAPRGTADQGPLLSLLLPTGVIQLLCALPPLTHLLGRHEVTPPTVVVAASERVQLHQPRNAKGRQRQKSSSELRSFGTRFVNINFFVMLILTFMCP